MIVGQYSSPLPKSIAFSNILPASSAPGTTTPPSSASCSAYERLLSCVERVLESGNLVLTPELADFEERVAQYTKSKHCIGLNSGTDALMMGLHAMGIGKGDEVITSPIQI